MPHSRKDSRSWSASRTSVGGAAAPPPTRATKPTRRRRASFIGSVIALFGFGYTACEISSSWTSPDASRRRVPPPCQRRPPRTSVTGGNAEDIMASLAGSRTPLLLPSLVEGNDERQGIWIPRPSFTVHCPHLDGPLRRSDGSVELPPAASRATLLTAEARGLRCPARRFPGR